MSNLNKSDVEKIISYLESKKERLEKELELYLSPISGSGGASTENVARIRGALTEINETLLVINEFCDDGQSAKKQTAKKRTVNKKANSPE